MRQKLSNNLKLGIIGDTGDTSPHPSLVPIECDPIEKIDPLSICWWCDEAMGPCHKCAGIDLSEFEKRVSGWLMILESCDHFCCGLPANVCHAKTLALLIKEGKNDKK